MIQHRGIWLPDGEQHLLPHLDNNPLIGGKGTYQYAKLELAVRQHTKRRNRAIDCGAHCGLWARILAERFQHVEAFEPLATHRECFELNVTAKNVTLHPCALGEAQGQVQFTIYPGNSGHSHVAMDGDGNGRQPGGLIQMETLDSFAFEDVDFLKIDTEGYELQVLKGARETLERWRPTIIVEQKPGNGSRYGYDDRAALAWLEHLGATLVAQKAGDFIFTWS